MTENQIYNWARYLYVSPRLSDKLASLGQNGTPPKSDAQSSTKIPDRPNRSPNICATEERVPFPEVQSLNETSNRGLALHFFANHELQAIELFSWALIRFWDNIPSNLRRAVAVTIGEEQRHLRLYLRRMQDWGLQLGQVGLSDFLWREISQAQSLEAFFAAMSVTFEQANLDYCLYYKGIFEDLGDHETAEILNNIYQDEIKHVSLGYHWLKSKLPESTHRRVWDYYRDLLPAPLNPRRARGIGFDQKGRRRAAIDEDFIHELKSFSQSRGRPADLLIFNPQAELQLSKGEGLQDFEVLQDLAAVMICFAKSDDIILVSKIPSLKHRQTLADWGFAEAQFVTPESLENQEVLAGQIYPWIAHQGSVERWLIKTRCGMAEPSKVSHDALAKVSSKLFWYVWALEAGMQQPKAFVTKRRYREPQAPSEGASTKWIAKAQHGASGHGSFILGTSEELLARDLPQASEVAAEFNSPAIIIEEFQERLADFSYHGMVQANGTCKFSGWTPFVCRESGAFAGTYLGAKARSRFLAKLKGWDHCPGTFLETLKQKHQQIGSELYRQNYRGPFSVDAYLYRDQGQEVLIRWLVEVNARLTMGQVALKLESKIAPGSEGFFAIVNKRQRKVIALDQLGSSAVFKATNEAPRIYIQKNLILQGMLALNDPDHAKHFLALLSVRPTGAPCSLIRALNIPEL